MCIPTRVDSVDFGLVFPVHGHQRNAKSLSVTISHYQSLSVTISHYQFKITISYQLKSLTVTISEQLAKQDELLGKHGERHENPLALLRTIPGCGLLSALVLISRIGDISRFAGPRALANYFGLTPTCKNSGEQTKRLGGISKEGSKLCDSCWD